MNAWDEPVAMLRRFADSDKLPYTILRNGATVFEQKYKGKSVPVSYVIDAEGQITFVHHDWKEGDEKKLSGAAEAVLAKRAG